MAGLAAAAADPMIDPFSLVWDLSVALIVSGAVFCALAPRVGASDLHDYFAGRHLALFVLVVGLAARGVLFADAPIVEDDYYRYLFDGALTANGFNPFAFSPQDALSGAAVPDGVAALAAVGASVVEAINYPGIRTIYPPTAQAAFALAYWIEPWSLDALRLVLLSADLAVFLLLAALLKRFARSALWLILYWWNPLVLYSTYQAAHMDVLMLPLIVGALHLVIRRRPQMAVTALALAAGVKVWPALLIPSALRYRRSDWRPILSGGAVGGGLIAVLFLPVLKAGVGGDSGFAVYTQYWQNNAPLLAILKAALPGDAATANAVARGLLGLVAVAVAFAVNRQPAHDEATVMRRFAIVAVTAFLLSPAQFPWYFLWVAPFLAIVPNPALLLLTALLPLWLIRAWLELRGGMETEAGLLLYRVLPFVQFVPVWLWLAWRGRRYFRCLRRGIAV